MSKHEMLTTGVDIIEVERVQQVLDRWGQRFLDRIFTDGEQTYCRGRAPNLAARFAAKEATMKALGTGVRGVSWKDIEVVRARSGAPSIRLTGRALQRFESLGLSHLALSMSHTKGNAVAMVVGQSDTSA
jgi:holo-[acyl-carrier protein] synthase